MRSASPALRNFFCRAVNPCTGMPIVACPARVGSPSVTHAAAVTSASASFLTSQRCLRSEYAEILDFCSATRILISIRFSKNVTVIPNDITGATI